jgi:hypothetical protein
MDDHLLQSLIGIIFIILAINTTMIVDIASRSPSQASIAGQGAGESGALLGLKTPTTTIPSVTPLQVRPPTPSPTTISPTPSLKQADNFITTYVTVETPVPVTTEEHVLLQPDVVESSYNDFITIFSLNQSLTKVIPNVSFNLVNPPLIIDYTVTPYNITDIKYIEYKQIKTYYSQNITVIRPYENTWFSVTVRDKNTGTVVAQDGFGKTLSMDRTKQLKIQKAGNFQFEFDGQFANVTLTMKVDKLGNNLD